MLGDTFGGSTSSDVAPPTDNASFDDTTPVGTLYNKGLDHVKAGEYKDAAKQFDEVERQHPYSAWARRAMLMKSFAYYQDNDYDEAIQFYDQAIDRNHPGHRVVLQVTRYSPVRVHRPHLQKITYLL